MKKAFLEFHLFKILNTFDFESSPLDSHLNQYFRSHKSLGSKDRKFLAETIYQMIRWKGLIDHYCSAPCNWENRYLALKKFNLKKSLLDSSIPLHVRLSFPKTFFEILHTHFGEEKAKAICLASNSKAPITLRVNLLKTNRRDLYFKWKNQYTVTPTKESVWGLNFGDRLNFHTLEEFNKGLFEIQDEGSQLVANLIDARPGDQVLDYCAGSGGKTLAFAHKLHGKGQIYLHDVRMRPLQNAKKRLKRAGIENSQILCSDSPNLKHLHGKMDWILVDVPCSGSGTLRRNPDLKWKFSSAVLKRLVIEQRKIMKQALAFLKSSGKIVYATCSILPQENEDQIEHFQHEMDLELVTRPFRSLPTEGGMDGFFGAVLRYSGWNNNH